MSGSGFDNDGRRKSIRDVFSHDPFYKRIKDALIIIFAVVGSLGYFGIDVSSLLGKHNKQEFNTEEKVNLKTRLGSLETSTVSMEASVSSMDHRLERVEDKVDKILLLKLARG